MYNYNYQQDNAYTLQQNEKSNIKLIGKVAGLCIIAYTVLENLLTIPLIYPTLYNLYNTNMFFQDTVTILLSIFCLLVPFAIGGRYLGKRLKCEPYPLEKPYDTKLSVSAVFLGFFVCLVANYISSEFVSFIESFGYTLSYNDFEVPSTVTGRIYYLITIAVVPALCEEVAVRGAIMQPLRRYGDKFAIVISAVVFAILHGNMVQIPFALIAGIGLGYVACITGSLWPSIAVHCINNLYSCITSFMLEDIKDTATLNRVYLIVMISLYIISIIGSVIFVFIKGHRSLNKITTYLTGGQKIKAFFISVPMIIALGIMFYITSNYISRG